MMQDLGAAFVSATIVASILLLCLSPFAIAWRVWQTRRTYERDPYRKRK